MIYAETLDALPPLPLKRLRLICKLRLREIREQPLLMLQVPLNGLLETLLEGLRILEAHGLELGTIERVAKIVPRTAGVEIHQFIVERFADHLCDRLRQRQIIHFPLTDDVELVTDDLRTLLELIDEEEECRCDEMRRGLGGAHSSPSVVS